MVYEKKKKTRRFKSGDACVHVVLGITGLTNHAVQIILSGALNLETKCKLSFSKVCGGD